MHHKHRIEQHAYVLLELPATIKCIHIRTRVVTSVGTRWPPC
jgi:hypothetical protein